MEYNYFNYVIDGAGDKTYEAMMDELNTYARSGWRVVNTTTNIQNGDIHYHYLLERDKSPRDLSEISEINERLLNR